MIRKFRSTEFKDIGNEMNEIILHYSIVNALGYNTTWLYSVTVTVPCTLSLSLYTGGGDN